MRIPGAVPATFKCKLLVLRVVAFPHLPSATAAVAVDSHSFRLLLSCGFGVTLLMGFFACGCCLFCSFQVQLRSHSVPDSLVLLAVAFLRLFETVATLFRCRLLVLRVVAFPHLSSAAAVVAVDSQPF